MQDASASARGLVLFSGTLDSQYAAGLLQEQGVELRLLHFVSPLRPDGWVDSAARRLGLPFRAEDLAGPLLEVLSRAAAPDAVDACSGLHAEMLKRARTVMIEEACSFLVTGEVLNQHLPAQTLPAFQAEEAAAGCGGLVLRPLSARLLPATLPESRGWIARERLGSLEGGGRKAQLQWAERRGVTEYPPLSEECRLCDRAFLDRALDLWTHEGAQGARSLRLLSLGRHFRIGPMVKLILGRNQQENMELEGLADLYDLVLKSEGAPGPTGLLPLTASEDEVRRAAAVCVSYGNGNGGERTRVRIRSARGSRWLEVSPSGLEEAEELRVERSRLTV